MRPSRKLKQFFLVLILPCYYPRLCMKGVFRLTEFYSYDACIGPFVHSSQKYSGISLEILAHRTLTSETSAFLRNVS
jgi:hypothetical protein